MARKTAGMVSGLTVPTMLLLLDRFVSKEIHVRGGAGADLSAHVVGC